MIVQRGYVLDALADADIDHDALHEDYSGRGMYGKSCLAVVGYANEIMRFVVYLARHLDDADESIQWMFNVNSDNMGLSTVWYWPGVNLSDE